MKSSGYHSSLISSKPKCSVVLDMPQMGKHRSSITKFTYTGVYWGEGKKQPEEPYWVSVFFFASQKVIWKSSIYSPTTFSLAAGRSKSFFCSSGLSGDSAQRQRTGTLRLQAQIKAVLVTRVNNKKLIKSVIQILCSMPISSLRLYLKLY